MRVYKLIGVICIAMVMWIFTLTLTKIIENSSKTDSYSLVDAKQSFLFRNR
jgi:hypothetical protein